MFQPVGALDLLELEDARARPVGRRRRVRREPAQPPRPPRVGVLRGPADRQRPPGHPPRVGPPVQGPLPPLPHDARQARGAQGRLGLPRPAGRGAGREGARLLGQARDRGLRHRAVQRASAARRCSATSRTGSRSPAASACGSTPPARTGRSRTTTSRACGGCSTRCGTTDSIYEGYKVVPYCGRCGTALSSHELGQPGAYRDVTEPSVYVRFPRGRPRLRPARVDHHAVDAAVERRRRGRARRRLRARARARRRPRPRDGARPRRPRCSATTPRWSAPVAAADLVGAALRAARSTLVPGRRRRVPRRRRRLRDRRRRLRHRAPRARVRRDRPRGRRARRPARRSTRSNDAAALHRRGRRAVRRASS